MKIIELIINETEDLMGVEAMSVVEHPAIESNFITLNKQKLQKYDVKLAVDEERRLLMGPALIPNKLIYRNDEMNGEYYIYFSTDTVKKASQLFLQAGNQGKATQEHERDIEGLTVVESWLKEDMVHDKSAIHGLEDPLGTWMICQKVDNDEVWEDAKSGKVKGFSIEAYFADRYEQPNEQGLLEQIKKILDDPR